MASPSPVERSQHAPATSRDWPLHIRIAFRFAFVYLSLYALAGQLVGGLLLFPNFSLPGLGTIWPMTAITTWTAVHVFGLTEPLVRSGNSGDTAYYWVLTFSMLMIALVTTGIWSDVDRRRPNYVALHKWFRLFVRIALASQMFNYGMAKIIPTQFPAPSLVTLVEPVGHLSLTDVLWTSIGASPAYQMFTGWAEMLAGFLLLVPRTTLAGAFVAALDMVEVFVLNMTFDFGLKQISFHLLLMSAFLIAPDVGRLVSIFVRGRAAPSSDEPPLFTSPRANQRALIAQIVFGVYLLAMYGNISRNYWYADGEPGAPKSPLYGIWDIERLAVDGEVRQPADNDYDRRWRRAIFDSTSVMAFQRTDDSFAHYGVAVDTGGRTIAFTKGDSRVWQSRFSYERPTDDRLLLDGEMDGYRIHAELRLVPLDTFRLLGSRFRLIRPSDQFGS